MLWSVVRGNPGRRNNQLNKNMNSEKERTKVLESFQVGELLNPITNISIRAKLELVDVLIKFECEMRRQYQTKIV